ncbi:uncharacterized protein LOC142980056 isoform X3 [Anticarsia gemmatalis]|uniref:uncharacterized protein LOC142980056 isoform X3 n=1 Tax=Anticarsia gemmatalis TaxID=129554 RepID=UPI003F7780C4
MAKKKVEIFVHIQNEKEFETIIKNKAKELICAEVFSNAFGYCTALDRLFNIIKLDWSNGKIILLKVPADEVTVLERFRDQSEPVYLFISNMKVTKVFRGVDMVRFGEVTKKELQYHSEESAGVDVGRRVYELDEPTPDELAWMSARETEKEEELQSWASRREARQAVRKRHRAELMVPHLKDLNFVVYWPHCLHAHPELYERWDANNIVMVGREMIDITEENVADIFYLGDAPLNEASLQKLYSGPALALCLRLLDDKCFTTLVRQILYEDIPPPPDDAKALAEYRRVTAFDYYKIYSPTRHEIMRQRAEDKIRRREEAKEKRARRLSEMQRLARQAIEEAVEAKKAAREQKKLELLKSGKVDELEKLKQEPEDNEVSIVIPEELSDEEVEESSEEEDPDEYFPPPGLVIPGFYSPPNDIAKSNGLAVLFPKLVHDKVTPASEFLPPHVLVMLDIAKRHKAIDAMAPHKRAIINMGIFKASSPYTSVHIAYSVKQFDTLDMDSLNLDEIKIVFMLSVVSDIPLLQLTELNPYHVSRDSVIGEEECAAMFPVDYGDDYDQFEDF